MISHIAARDLRAMLVLISPSQRIAGVFAAGLLCVAIGCWEAWSPLGWIVAGLELAFTAACVAYVRGARDAG